MLTDREIAIVKTMLSEGMIASDIHFYFNRKDRVINLGRISEIKNGRNKASKRIPPASKEEMNEFISSFNNGTYLDPLSRHSILSLFSNKDGVWRIRHDETDRVECKESFSSGSNWLRTIAGLSNNRGGYIIFGVRDDDHDMGKLSVVGLKDSYFVNADPADIADKVRSVFDPTPSFVKGVVDIDGCTIGIIYVNQHSGRPVIASRNAEGVKEGDIYFRYSGSTARIKYSDLRSLFDDRDSKSRLEMIPLLERLMDLGPKNAMVIDLSSKELLTSTSSIPIDEELIRKMVLVKEGEFVEGSGYPSLKLVGSVHTASDESRHVITKSDMISDFLSQSINASPTEYLRFYVEQGNSAWLPIHFYISKSDINYDEAVEFIRSCNSTSTIVERAISRITKKDSAYKLHGGSPNVIRDIILKNGELDYSSEQAVGHIGYALQGIENNPFLDKEHLIGICSDIYHIALERNYEKIMSPLRKGIARIDELTS